MIPQYEELRPKVLIGREIHEQKVKTLGTYLRKRIGVVDKKVNLRVVSKKLGLSGIIDELLFFDDGTVGPLDYKFAEWKGWIHKTLYYQSIMYGVLAEEALGMQSLRGYVVYTRSSNHIERIDFPDNKTELVKKLIEHVLDIIVNEVYPESTASKMQCSDCAYRKICLR